MRKSAFTEEQIALALRQAEGGTTVGEICRKLQVSEATFYRWKKKFGDSGAEAAQGGEPEAEAGGHLSWTGTS